MPTDALERERQGLTIKGFVTDGHVSVLSYKQETPLDH